MDIGIRGVVVAGKKEVVRMKKKIVVVGEVKGVVNDG